jgi:hypothetical protein
VCLPALVGDDTPGTLSFGSHKAVCGPSVSSANSAAISMGLQGLVAIRGNSCQRKVEISGFPPDRNVGFHGFLQG